MYYNELIGERIKNLRNDKGLSREKFAEIAKLSPRFLSDIESGKKSMSIESLMKICLAFNVSADYIVFGNDINLNSPLQQILYQIPSEYNNIIENILKDLLKTINLSNKLNDKKSK